MIRLSICILAAAGIALSGCGSSSSGGSSSFAERARDVTNAESPALTPAQIQQRGESVFGNVNYLSSSRLHVQTDNENIPDTVIDSDCVRTTCTYTVRDNSGRAVANVPVSLSDLETSERRQAVLTRNGVTTFMGQAESELGSARSYGTWLEHGGFAVAEVTQTIETVQASFVYGLAGGAATGSAPLVDATYQGLMVGSPVAGEHRGDILQGDATLEYAFAERTIDAEFTNIVDLDHGMPHTTEEIQFGSVGVNSGNGTFNQSSPSTNKFIEGTFAGLGSNAHDEVLGTFESDGVAGAFGAIREQRSGGSSSFAERAQDVTNAESPALTLAQIQQRDESVFGNSNYLSSSRLHVQTDNENIRDTVIDSDCVRTTCTYTVRDNSGRAVANVPVSLSDLETSGNLETSERRQAVLTRNGVTTFMGQAEFELGSARSSARSYGAWLEHGGFAVTEEVTQIIETVQGSFVYGLAGGAATGSAPLVDATYQGLMVGSPVAGEHRGDILQGDATLEYAFAERTIDAAFTNIVNLDHGMPHTTEAIQFGSVGVNSGNGTFNKSSPSTNKFIEGTFAGLGSNAHDEVLGTFESDGVAGAFGAIREP